MNDDQRNRIIEILQAAKSDDLWRAKHAFQSLTPAQMDEQWGASGLTRKQALERYQQREDEINDLIEAVRMAK
jgi:hypothetical protein